MLGRLGWQEILLILLVFALLFGASKLPQLGRAMGDTIREFRKSVREEDGGKKG